MGKTITEKIIAKSINKKIVPGEIVTIKPDLAVCMEYFMPQFLEEVIEVGAKTVWDPNKIFMVMDHRVPAVNILFAEKHKAMREFAKKHGIKHIYDVGRGGISHLLTGELGLVLPGTIYAADDTHATTLGAFGCFAAAFLYDMVEILATGGTWIRVPETIRVELKGDLQKGVVSRDIIQYIIGDIGYGGALNKVLEFGGPLIEKLNMDARRTLCNLVPHVSAETAIINPDKTTLDFVNARTDKPYEVLTSDLDCDYDKVLTYDVSGLGPMVAVPHDPLDVKTVAEVAGTPIHQGVIGSCANGNYDDLLVAAQVVEGKTIHPQSRLIVIPGTQIVYKRALKSGILGILVDAGAIICAPNCGPCAGGHMGVLAAGENCLTTTTLNVKGRMGSPEANIFMGSPTTVASSCLEGQITDPRKYWR